jgi:hypothetical protein
VKHGVVNSYKRKYREDKLTREFYKDCYYDSDGYMHERERATVVRIATHRSTPTAPRTGHRARSEGARSSAASGDGNSSDDSEPERRQPSLPLYDQASLAALLRISKKSVQNIYSSTPHLLPAAIQIPGARGPRWTAQAVQTWLSERPRHTSKPAPVAPKKKAGRPRIALAVKGGAA